MFFQKTLDYFKTNKILLYCRWESLFVTSNVPTPLIMKWMVFAIMIVQPGIKRTRQRKHVINAMIVVEVNHLSTLRVLTEKCTTLRTVAEILRRVGWKGGSTFCPNWNNWFPSNAILGRNVKKSAILPKLLFRVSFHNFSGELDPNPHGWVTPSALEPWLPPILITLHGSWFW